MFNSVISLSELDGNNGFVINGVTSGDRAGFSVSSAGDINNDGIDDLIIGAPSTIPNGTTGAGASYIVFGVNNLGNSSSFDLADLDGSNGFVINQINPNDSNEISVNNAGDINSDGIDDLIIGASTADPNSNNNSGESYVVFGNTNVGSSGSFDLSTLDGSNGFILNGIDSGDRSGRSVSNLGDINGDDIDDIILGAPAADPNGNNAAGESYVVFGNTSIGSLGSIELSSLNGNNGFIINGIDPGDFKGFTASNAGDVNNDGVNDLIIGAGDADPNGNNAAGESYVVFGNTSIGSLGSIELSSLNGNNGFVINGVDAGDLSGRSVSNAGDINGDGIDDIIIGAPNADSTGNNAGESYVVFGNTSIGSSGSIELSSLNGNNGFVINGINAGDFSGRSVSNAGDLNSDGIDDIVIGATRSETSNSNAGAGDSYVIFGATNIGNSGSLDLSSLNGNNGFLIDGIDTTNSTGYSVSNAGDVNNDGVSDIIVGAFEAAANGNIAAGQSYVIFGIPQAGLPCDPTNGDDDLTGCATAGNDTVNGLAGNDTIAGGNGDDSLLGASGNDSLSGEDGRDTLIGGVGFDTLIGGDGDDNLNGGNDNDLLDGNSGMDRIFGGSEDDTLNGGSEDDTLLGGTGVDLLNGDTGDDRLNGGDGDDILNGGLGNDNLSGNEGNDILNGNEGIDILNGNEGDDTLNGGTDSDRLNGGAGLDELNGGDGDDFLNGSDGNDTVSGGAGNDTVLGGVDSGADLLNGNDGNDRLGGSLGDDTLNGGDGNDTLVGSGDNDLLNGGTGDDSLFGSIGLDELNGDDGNDFLNGALGDDTLNGGDGNDTLLGLSDSDFLNGDGDDDELFGGIGNDTLNGGDGNDLLSGQGNDDFLSGGLGLDTLFGGNGVDQFAIVSGVTSDRDFIQDFENGVDLLDLTGNLTFGDLSFSLSQNGNITFITEIDTNQILAGLRGITPADLDPADFV